MRMITVSNLVDNILAISGRSDDEFTRVLRVVAAGIEEMDFHLFTRAKTIEATLNQGLSVAAPQGAMYVNKVGVVNQGTIWIADLTAGTSIDFTKRSTGCECSDTPQSDGPQSDVGHCPSCTFFNCFGTYHRYGLRQGPQPGYRATVDSEKNAIFFDGNSQLHKGQKVLIEYTPGPATNDAGQLVIPADAANLFRHYVDKTLAAYDTPGTASLHQASFDTSWNSFRLRNADTTLDKIVEAVRGSFSRTVKG